MSESEQTPALTEFLRARIAEDEAWAGTSRFARHNGSNGVRRALAECEAKRRIVELHPAQWNEAWRVWHCPTCSDSSHTDWNKPTWPCMTLLTVASIYADHADFRAEWRP